MAKKTKQNLEEKTLPIDINYTDRQSVRTSFRLSEAGKDALKWLAKHHGITAKDVFDKFCQDSVIEIYADMASKTRNDQTPPKNSVRKTLVISKGALKTLKTLKEFSKKHKIRRDEIVDFSLIFLQSVTKQVLEKEQENNPRALEIISQFITQADSVEEKLQEILVSNPILDRFSSVMIILENLRSAIESNLKEGTPIDPDDFSQSC